MQLRRLGVVDGTSGEIVALVGQNGSAKSTLVKVLTGVYEPDPGARISVAGPRHRARHARSVEPDSRHPSGPRACSSAEYSREPRSEPTLRQACTLEPGDVIATGTSFGAAFAIEGQPWLQPGDRVRVELEGIGAIEHEVVQEQVAGAVAGVGTRGEEQS